MGGTSLTVVQEYVDRPLLLGGYKFDLRLYVLVSSCVPLRVHIFRDGIARLCAEKYHSARAQGGSAGGDWRFRHLTNYAINKQHPDFSVAEDGTKRRLGAVLDELASQGHDVALLWGEMQQLAVKALIAVQPTLAQSYMSCRPGPDVHPFSCFELLGLDLLIDDTLKPWLLEVNHSPSLACDTPLDKDLKDSLLSDTMRLCSSLPRRASCCGVPTAPPRRNQARVRAPPPPKISTHLPFDAVARKTRVPTSRSCLPKRVLVSSAFRGEDDSDDSAASGPAAMRPRPRPRPRCWGGSRLSSHFAAQALSPVRSIKLAATSGVRLQFPASRMSTTGGARLAH